MTASAYMDDVKVEIAFNAGYATPSGLRVWTDVSAYAELKSLIPITRGRTNEMATTEANKLTSLTLDNRDGRFTPGKVSGAYYPNVKIGRPIRVTATRPGGIASVRFLGFIDEWPTEWDGTEATAMARITASSRLARLGLDTEMENLMVTKYLDANPVQLFTLLGTRNGTVLYGNDPTVLAYTGNGPPTALSAGPSPEGEATCALFNAFGGTNGQYLLGGLGATSSGPVTVIEAWVSTTEVNNGEYFVTRGLPVNLSLGIALNNSVRATILEMSGATDAIGSTVVTDGELHHTAAVFDETANRVRIYIDGKLEASTACTAPAMNATGARIGAAWIGSVSFAMISNDEAGIGARAGTAPMPASDMIELFATAQGIPAAELDLDSGTTDVYPFDPEGKSALDAMRVVEATEGGVLFDRPDGRLAFRRRSARYGTSSAFTLSVAAQQIESDYAPVLDRSALANDVSATAADGTVQRVINTASRDDYGPARRPLDIAGTPDDAFQAATRQVILYAEPQSRVPSVRVDVLALPDALRDSIAAADVGTRFTLAGLLSQAATATVDYFIEGIAETFGPESHVVTFNVSPTTGFGDVWTLGDPVLGQYDAYPIAY